MSVTKKVAATVCLIAIGLLAAAPAVADPGIEWVTVGDPGNPPDPASGRGAVAGEFQISKHEVTVGQYAAFLNAVAKDDPHGLWTGGLPIARTGNPGAFAYAATPGREREPVVHMRFFDCMRFANWLHHLQGEAPADPALLTETGAYEIAAGGGLAARSAGARAWIPNQDEWYKAAYHHPHAAGGPPGHYWKYPTKHDAQPTAGKAGDTSPNVANFMINESDYSRALMPVGGFPNAASHYGTFDQGGNAWEWVEATVFDTQRMLRGGSLYGSHEKMLSVTRSSVSPTRRYQDVGFRVARAVPPEPPPAAPPPAAAGQPDLTAWTDTFDSEETLDRHWSYYGYLPAGGVVNDREHRAQYWQVVDGQLQGNDLPDVHGSGISRPATGTDVRVSIRFKLPPKGCTSVALRGNNPILECEWYVMGLHVWPTAIHAFDETTAHPKDSPEAAALKAKGGWNRRFIHDAKVVKMEIAEDAWHELVMEARGREQKVWLDGREVLTYTTLAGDVPKTSVSIGMHSDEPRLVHGYFDDLVFGPLE